MRHIILNDGNKNYDQATQYFEEANLWARQHCASYQGCEVQDVSDFSDIHDMLAHYSFGNEKDVVIFQLRWS